MSAIVVLMDAILALVVVEALALALYHHLTRRGLAPRAYAANLAAGFFLLLTARLVAGGASPWLIPLGLLAALCAHVTDIALRWPRSR